MPLLRHSIEINSSIENAFQICADVQNWPNYFPPCKKVKILNQSEYQQLVEITATANDSEMTWQSQREIDSNSYTIHFSQIKPSPLLKQMEGAWRLYPLMDGVLVSLEHKFEVNEVINTDISGVNNKEDAIQYMETTIRSNSTKELEALKKILETSDSMAFGLCSSFHETQLIPKPVNEVFQLLKDIKKWPLWIPHCRKIEVLYDDDMFQEFSMQVKTQEKIETLRSIRHCQEPYSIHYFQPNPPEVLTQHHGRWCLEAIEDQTLLISEHYIQLNPDNIKKIWGDIKYHEALQRIEDAINENSVKTMEALIKYTHKEGKK